MVTISFSSVSMSSLFSNILRGFPLPAFNNGQLFNLLNFISAVYCRSDTLVELVVLPGGGGGGGGGENFVCTLACLLLPQSISCEKKEKVTWYLTLSLVGGGGRSALSCVCRCLTNKKYCQSFLNIACSV